MKEKKQSYLEKLPPWAKKHNKGIKIGLIIYLIVLIFSIALPCILKALPYEVKIGDNSMYVTNKASASSVLDRVHNEYISAGSQLLKFSSKPMLSVCRANPFKSIGNTISAKEASDQIIKILNDPASEVSVSYIVTKNVAFMPEPDYIKDKKMLAGREHVKKKGVKGRKDVSTLISAVNGKVVSKNAYHEKVTKKGIPPIVRKGTLGLPKGEDWKEYTGDPIYNNADDLITTAYNYLGAPYKHGGTSLKKGVSCVGFVRAIYMKYGIKIGNSHHSMETAGIGVSYKNARKGDIICYRGHVGLYIGNGKMLDATSKRGVGVNTVHPKSIIAVRRIVK